MMMFDYGSCGEVCCRILVQVGMNMYGETENRNSMKWEYDS